jgi:nicotinic acid mononucleotide adenylyltransferase
MFINPPLKNVSIFSGSFNPFHVGHYEMYNESLSHPLLKNTPLVFELTTKNADK